MQQIITANLFFCSHSFTVLQSDHLNIQTKRIKKRIEREKSNKVIQKVDQYKNRDKN